MNVTGILRTAMAATGAMLCLGSVIGQTASAALVFDGNWWQQASRLEQQGFIVGYQDCKQPAIIARASVAEYQAAVSGAVTGSAVSDPHAATSALEAAWKSLKPADQTYAARYGYVDGSWWGNQSVLWGDADKGYAEGYLQCNASAASQQAVTQLQSAINQHYAGGAHDPDKVMGVAQQLMR